MRFQFIEELVFWPVTACSGGLAVLYCDLLRTREDGGNIEWRR